MDNQPLKPGTVVKLNKAINGYGVKTYGYIEYPHMADTAKRLVWVKLLNANREQRLIPKHSVGFNIEDLEFVHGSYREWKKNPEDIISELNDLVIRYADKCRISEEESRTILAQHLIPQKDKHETHRSNRPAGQARRKRSGRAVTTGQS